MSATLHGVTDTPPPYEPTFQLASMAPRKRRTGLIIGLAVAGVVLVAGAAGATGYVLASKDDPAPPAAAAPATAPSSAPAPTTAGPAPSTAAPTSALPPLTERATCRELVPLMEIVIDAATALGQQHKMPDATQMRDTEGKLRVIESRAPQDMRADIDVITLSATTMQAGNLDGTSLSESGVRLLQRCRKYAS